MRLIKFHISRIRLLIFVSVILALCFYLYENRIPTSKSLSKLAPILGDIAVQQACRMPDLDPHSPVIFKHITESHPLKCGEEDWLIIKNGHVSINQNSVLKHKEITCTITYLERKDDFSSTSGKEVTLSSDVASHKLLNDFFWAKCSAQDGSTWKNIMAGIHRNDDEVEKLKKIEPSKDASNLNVLMFGFDSMSRMHFMRKLPKTYDYLVNVLNAVVLKGYNIVGDGTPQALIPILTGFTELELPETRKRMQDANFVNVYPLVWKNFSANGYVTAWAEDTPNVGIFTYRLKGFGEIPTTHYMRSFYVEAAKEFHDHKYLCLGGVTRHEVMLNWLREFYNVYSDVPKFAFGFHGEISHDDFNLVGIADDDVVTFMRGLQTSGILNNTILIMMSDHGNRFGGIRATQQGKLEERLPFFSIVTPPWFQKTYPVAYKNLQENADYLTTPFDIYSTFLSVLTLNKPATYKPQRSLSLFSPIPKERSCADARIEPHWCACLTWQPISPTDQYALEAGQAVVDFINQYTEPQREICSKLNLDLITRSEHMLPNKALVTFLKSVDADGFVANFTDNAEISEIIYQVQLRAFPSSGMYEALVRHDLDRGTYKVHEKDISRINMYGSQAHCVYEKYPHLRKYCYCKVQV